MARRQLNFDGSESGSESDGSGSESGGSGAESDYGDESAGDSSESDTNARVRHVTSILGSTRVGDNGDINFRELSGYLVSVAGTIINKGSGRATTISTFAPLDEHIAGYIADTKGRNAMKLARKPSHVRLPALLAYLSDNEMVNYFLERVRRDLRGRYTSKDVTQRRFLVGHKPDNANTNFAAHLIRTYRVLKVDEADECDRCSTRTRRYNKYLCVCDERAD